MGKNTSTYSFTDMVGSITHPLAGNYLFQGEGIGELTVEMLTDNPTHDRASDGSIMVSKIAGQNGQITITVQQTSDFHKWLLALYNNVYIATTDQWAAMQATLRNIVDGTGHVLNGMSFQKPGPKGYKAQGGMVTWILMAADVQNPTS